MGVLPLGLTQCNDENWEHQSVYRNLVKLSNTFSWVVCSFWFLMQKTEIATLVFDDILFPNTGNPKLIKFWCWWVLSGVHIDPLRLPDYMLLRCVTADRYQTLNLIVSVHWDAAFSCIVLYYRMAFECYIITQWLPCISVVVTSISCWTLHCLLVYNASQVTHLPGLWSTLLRSFLNMLCSVVIVKVFPTQVSYFNLKLLSPCWDRCRYCIVRLHQIHEMQTIHNVVTRYKNDINFILTVKYNSSIAWVVHGTSLHIPCFLYCPFF